MLNWVCTEAHVSCLAVSYRAQAQKVNSAAPCMAGRPAAAAGSGVLALAALKLGASSAVCTDVDPLAVSRLLGALG